MNSAWLRTVLLLSVLSVTACQQAPTRESAMTGPPVVATPRCECPEPRTESLSCPPPQPEPVAPQPCPNPVATRKSLRTGSGLLVIGRVEYVLIKRNGMREAPLKLKARIDTGAGLTAMQAYDKVEFERDGAPWVRFGLMPPKSDKPLFFERPVKRYVNIKQFGGALQRRPVVRMSVSLGDIEENVEVTLVDRSDYVYQVLVGRNFLRDRAIVDVRRKFIADDGFRHN